MWTREIAVMERAPSTFREPWNSRKWGKSKAYDTQLSSLWDLKALQTDLIGASMSEYPVYFKQPIRVS